MRSLVNMIRKCDPGNVIGEVGANGKNTTYIVGKKALYSRSPNVDMITGVFWNPVDNSDSDYIYVGRGMNTSHQYGEILGTDDQNENIKYLRGLPLQTSPLNFLSRGLANTSTTTHKIQ